MLNILLPRPRTPAFDGEGLEPGSPREGLLVPHLQFLSQEALRRAQAGAVLSLVGSKVPYTGYIWLLYRNYTVNGYLVFGCLDHLTLYATTSDVQRPLN